MNDFILTHYFLTTILFIVSVTTLQTIILRTYRIIMVIFRGWPPSHLDADGDFKSDIGEDSIEEDKV
jgi:hypothetical protein